MNDAVNPRLAAIRQEIRELLATSNNLERDPACWSWDLPTLGSLDSEARQRDALWAWHDGRCGICGGDGASPLDHDHVTGLARGYLCFRCNSHEGRSDRRTDVYARWRACPASAMLGIRLIATLPDGRNWTGFTYLPEWAPWHHDWPHARTVGLSPFERGA